MMQEMIRTCYDECLEEEAEGGKSAKLPIVLPTPRGTPSPSTLILFREHSSRFSLQSAYPKSLVELNTSLNIFYMAQADITIAERWLMDNTFEDAVADEAEAEWMAK
ncbi:hypothetical protein OEA41_005833 [Lepraria neglecta]|uniref:Tse2 ADP-ribosyltransferase toxin domain-containing protein n=1 Tax=Lepraria neglecta TaxID=209136 RepID=A0AAE0DK28_9LECA|nr:hypothetical protein OEA41_005833 [Lepraria neglecta]